MNNHPNSQEFLIKCEYCKEHFTHYELKDHQITNHSSEIKEAFKLIKCEHCKHYFNRAELEEHQCSEREKKIKETIPDSVSPKQNDNSSEAEEKGTKESTEGDLLKTPESGGSEMKVRSDLSGPSTSRSQEPMKTRCHKFQQCHKCVCEG